MQYHSRQAEIRELLLQRRNELLSNLVLQIILLILVPLLHSGITTNWRDIDHAVPELDECTSLDRNIEICDVMQHEPDELFVWLFSNPFNEAVAGEWNSHTVRSEAVLGEAEVEHGGDGYRLRAELLLLLCQV